MHRLGGRVAVALGLLIIGIGAALRAIWPSALPLYLMTAVLSLGIALAQTSTVALVRLWFPRRIGFASALYTNGIIFGEALGAGLTLPLLGLFGPDAWRLTVAAWAAPVIAVLALWLASTPEGRPPVAASRQRPMTAEKGTDAKQGPAHAIGHAIGPEDMRIAGRPFWLLGIHLGLLSGCCSLIYFNMNAWTAPYNAALGNSSLTPLSLALLNASQLPVCLALTPFAQRMTGRRLPFALSGLFCLVAIAGWTWTPAAMQPIWAAVFGGSSVAVLVLGLALPPFYSTPETVARLVGATLSVSYLLSFAGQIVGGRLWDLSGQPIFAFAPVPVAALALVLLAALLPGRSSQIAAERRTTLVAGSTG
jgi:CP family cyanate transporter-like MFS transporter